MLVKRAIAIAIDSLIVGILPAILGFILDDTIIPGVIGFIIGAAYQWYFLTRNNGQTPGKGFMGIRVVGRDGAISDVEAVIRYVGYWINNIFLIGWIVAIITGRGFHDRLAGTQVVDA